MELATSNIDHVDPWEVYYEVGTDDFYVYDRSTELEWKPVFLYDNDGYPSDFIGWNPVE